MPTQRRFSTILIAMFVITAVGVNTPRAAAQRFLEQLEQRVQKGINDVSRNFQPPQGKIGNNNGAQFKSQSMPSEGGNKNLPGGGFNNGGGFVITPTPSTGPIYTQPVNPQPNYGQPNYGQPYYGQPTYTQPGSNRPTYDRYGQPIYTNSQPAYVNSSSMSQANSGENGIPAPPIDVASSPYITIRCPDSTTGSCSYTLISSLGRYAFNISGGQEQRFRKTADWVIRYDEGGVTKSYRLQSGRTYRLRKDDSNQWRLFVAS